MAAEKQRLGAERWLIYGDIDKELNKLRKALATPDPPGPNQREIKVRRANLADLIEKAKSTHIRYLALLKMDITTVDPENEFWGKLCDFEKSIPWEEEDFTVSPVRADPLKAEREMEEYELYFKCMPSPRWWRASRPVRRSWGRTRRGWPPTWRSASGGSWPPPPQCRP